MSKVIKTSFGTWANPKNIALGSVSPVQKIGAFYCFSMRLDNDDIREYSFTTISKANHMRKIMIGHLEVKFKSEIKKFKS